MLTVNADDHSLMRDYHKPNDEKRMVVILPEDGYDAWLQAKPDQSQAFLRQLRAAKLVAKEPEAEGGLL